MLTRRIIPCLDIKDGRVVKGVQFQNLRPQGDPLDLARRHVDGGADELCLLDVTASVEARPLLIDLIRRLSDVVPVPFIVGGGIRSVTDARDIVRAGADRISVNTAAVQRPELLRELSREFGARCVVLSIDACSHGETWHVTTHGGRKRTDWTALDWARQAVDLGAGEILLNVIDTDGQRQGFSIEITDAVSRAVRVPVIASGGAGNAEDFVELFRKTRCSAALAASVFHDGSWTANRLKEVLRGHGIEVRLG